MELVNRKYVRLNSFDVSGGYLDAIENGDEKKLKYFQKLFNVKLMYESKNRTYISYIYIKLDDESFSSLGFNMSEIKIGRESLVNAFFIASYCFNTEMQTKLSKLLSQDFVLPSELDKEVLEYILNNSMDIYDFLNGKNKKGFVYDGEELITEIVFDHNNLDTPHLPANSNTEDVGDKRKAFTNNPIQHT